MEELRQSATDVGISRLAHYELLVGALHLWRKHGDITELAWLEQLMKWVTVYEVDAEVIKMAADIKSRAMKEGEEVPDMDLLIAVSGKSNTIVLTSDGDHVRIENYLREHGVKVAFMRN